MSDRELQRLEVLRDLDRRRLTTEAAVQLLGLERRQVFRLLKAYRIEGPSGLISKRRGRRSNRRKPEALRRAVLTIIRQWYWDFGPTLAAEKLREDHGIAVGRETLRQWMIEAGLWLDRRQRSQAHSPAAAAARVCWRTGAGRRQRALVVRGPRSAMHLAGVCRRRDQPADASAICRERVALSPISMRPATYLEAWGKPVAFYSDKHGVFRVNHTGALGGDGMTQFGRALHALNIDIICANSSQAKGRVERANGTLQDRLVKEMRLAASTPWRPATPSCRRSWPTTTRALPRRRSRTRICIGRCAAHDDLDDAFAWKEERTFSQALTLQYDKILFILNRPTRPGGDRKRVIVIDYPDGRLAIRYRGIDLAYRTFDKVRQVNQAAIVENKRLGPILAFIRKEQLRREPECRSGPRRRDQRDARLFKDG